MAKRNLVLSIAVAMLLVLPHVSAAKTTIKAAAGQIGGGWYTIVSGLAEIVNSELKNQVQLVVVPGSGVSNIATCSLGQTPITMSFPPFIIAAKKGIDPYDTKYPKTKVIASGFGTSAQHLVTTREDFHSYGDIVAKKLPIRIALNKPGATDEFIWRKIMEYYKFDYKDISKWGGKVFFVGHGEAVQLIKDHHADTHFSYISVPAASITEMAIARKLTFINVPDDLLKYLEDEWALFQFTIPARTYQGQDKELVSLGMSNTLMVNADISDDLVYAITKTICENYKDVRNIHKACENWKPEIAPQGVESLLHPGALRYYKEMGYVK